jgi:serine-type D-Ala-D-Ala carboxypeptidase
VNDPVRGFLLHAVTQDHMPGAAWWVGQGQRVLSRGAVGRVAIEPEAEAVQLQTPFDLASLTKPLATASLFALLEQEGAIDPQAPLRHWLPELDASPYAELRLETLAVHAGRMPAWHPLFAGASSVEGYLQQIANLEPATGPGETLYSDLGYVALGAAVARAANRPLDRLFAERIARPLGLRRTAFAGSAGSAFGDAAATERGSHYERELAGAAARGFAWRERIPRGTVHDTNAWALGGIAGHAGLFGTAEEVARMALELLRPQALGLGVRARSRLLEPSGPGADRTAGFELARRAAAARGVLPDAAPGHTGFTGTSIWIDPARERVFVLLTNRIHPRVPSRPFHVVRRGFHRAATHLLER